MCQWRKVISESITGSPFYPAITFVDSGGASSIGFASLNYAYRTTDGGKHWVSSSHHASTDYAFKDNLTGWCAAGSQVYRTTDGGATWLPSAYSPGRAIAITYSRYSNRLICSSFGLGKTMLASTDEGITWTTTPSDGRGTGFAFCDDSTGVVAGQRSDGNHWQRTTDGGLTWQGLAIDTECWQPLAIPHTKTFFAVADVGGQFLRTDDAWETWRVVYNFPLSALDRIGATSGCVRGDLRHLFVQLADGVYESTDEGQSWQSLCGPSETEFVFDHRFYADSSRVFAAVSDYPNRETTLWMLDLDSLRVRGNAVATFFDGLKYSALAPGSNAVVYYSNTSSDSSAESDSAHFTVRYDRQSLNLKHSDGLNGWQIVNEIDQPGSIEVWLRGSGSLSTLPILSTTFATVLADTVARVYLDQPMIYSHRKNCDCAVTNNPGSDSVEIDFTGCGGPTLWHFMQTGSVFDVLSVSPNPAGGELRVDIRERGEGDVRAEVIDVLGERRFTQDLASGSSRIDVSGLESGSYFLRLSKDGEVRTRRFLVRH